MAPSSIPRKWPGGAKAEVTDCDWQSQRSRSASVPSSRSSVESAQRKQAENWDRDALNERMDFFRGSQAVALAGKRRADSSNVFLPRVQKFAQTAPPETKASLAWKKKQRAAPGNLCDADPQWQRLLEQGREPALRYQEAGAVRQIAILRNRGLQLDEATGVISGMARRIADVAQYTVTAENDSGKCSTTMAFAIKVMPPEALLYPGVDDAYNVGEGVYLEPMVLGGPTSWSVDPPLPQGFELDRSHGVITGAGEAPVPETSYTVTASNETGGTSVVLTFKVGTIGLAELQYPGVSSEFHVTQAVKLDPKLGSGTAEKFTIEPELPQGLQLDAATGVISGRPQCPVESKQYKVTAWSGGDKTEVTFTFACSDIERVKPKTWGCDPAYARMIEEITDIADMPPQPSRQEREFDWMVWMVHCVWLNDPMLKTLNFSGLKMPLPHEEPRVAPKLMKALAHNTNLASLQLADSNLRAQQGHELAESLRQNKTLKELNVESNKLDCESVQVLAGALKETQDSVLEIWRLANQHDIGDNLGTNVEKSLAEMLEKNMRIVKLGVSLQNPHWNQMITKYLTRNSDEARRRRKQAAGGGAAAPATLVEKPFAALVVMAPPNDKAAWEVFEEPEDGLLSVVRELMANKVKMPSREQLQAFAKGKGKPMPFSAVAPLLKKFQSLLLDSVVNCQVCARAEATGGQRTEGVLKAWSEKNDRWSVEVWTKEGSRYRFNSQKQPVIEPSPEVAAWLRPPEA